MVAADIHVVGHYQGVQPASAERAVDKAISGTGRRIIADHTRRRWLVGALGEISYFPGPGNGTRDAGDMPVRAVAVAGMGRLGTFDEKRATTLYASVLRELGGLSQVRTVAMSLIGSGAGNLSVREAARALVAGFESALHEATQIDDVALSRTIHIVEIDRLRAEQLAIALGQAARDILDISVLPRVDHSDSNSGQVSRDSAAVLAIRALAQSLRREVDAPSGGRRRHTANPLFAQLPEELHGHVRKQLQAIPDDLEALAVTVGRNRATERTTPTRISVTMPEVGPMRWAALTERATVPEREVAIDPRLVDQLIKRLTAPTIADASILPRMLSRFVVPIDLQEHVTAEAPLVLEVDLCASGLPWEFLVDRAHDVGDESLPLAVRTPIARQLRTSYARVVPDREQSATLRALIIADPGGAEHSLRGARQEGLAVRRALENNGVEVNLFIGGPGSGAPPERASVATQLDVLTELLVRSYDIVHYAGHGTLDRDNPLLSGWLFADGILSSRELSQLTWAPQLVVANACWSAAGFRPPSTGTPIGEMPAPTLQRPSTAADPRAVADLTPQLASEFLRAGVVHYIGTSWEVPDGFAAQFATSFYTSLLQRQEGSPRTVGEALCEARSALFGLGNNNGLDLSDDVGGRQRHSAWAAYQHYGDPSDIIEIPSVMERLR